MLVNGAMPEGAGFFLRSFIVFFRKDFARKYISSYKKIRSFTKKEFNDWLLVRSMARLAYCNDDEKPWLMRYISKYT